MEVKRWFRHSRKPSASSSQLPPATPQPGFTRGETASCKGRLGRLELLDAKVSRAVLRGRDGGNIILLPDTDVKDAEWIADLLQHGLLKASFIPSSEQQAVRDLTRTRMRLTQERTRLINRIQKVLEDANRKLASVVSDIMGVSGQAILMALLAGQEDPERLAHLARGSLVKKEDQLQAA